MYFVVSRGVHAGVSSDRLPGLADPHTGATKGDAMQNGIYSLRFTIEGVERTEGAGLVVLRDRCVNGGDETFLYQGSFAETARKINGEITVTQWNRFETSGPRSLYNPSRLVVSLTGNAGEDRFHTVGKGPNGAVIEVSGRLVAPLIEPA